MHNSLLGALSMECRTACTSRTLPMGLAKVPSPTPPLTWLGITLNSTHFGPLLSHSIGVKVDSECKLTLHRLPPKTVATPSPLNPQPHRSLHSCFMGRHSSDSNSSCRNSSCSNSSCSNSSLCSTPAAPAPPMFPCHTCPAPSTHGERG